MTVPETSVVTRPRNLRCTICGCTEFLHLFSGARDGKFETVACRGCGIVSLADIPEPALVEDRYASGAFSVEARGSATPSESKFTQSEHNALRRLQRLIDLVGIDGLRSCRSLEIGCGLGSFSWMLSGLGANVVGLEPDPTYAASGRDLYEIPIDTEFYEHRPAPQSPYDLVSLFQCLEHVPSPRQFLEKAYREIAAGGLLYLDVPCIERPMDGDLPRFFWSEHLYTFSRTTLSGLLNLVGFDVCNSGYDGDVLWMLARRSESSAARRPLPFDDAEAVVRRTLCMYARHLKAKRRSANGFVSRVTKRVTSLFRAVPHKLISQPADFIPAIIRESASVVRGRAADPSPRIAPDSTVHFGLHERVGNAGDAVLFNATRDLMSYAGIASWTLLPLHSTVTRRTACLIRERARSVVVGGGGLFLADTNRNTLSGWQWPYEAGALRQLGVPLFVVGVGYNRFRGQEEFHPVFWDSLAELVEVASFVGVRNRGSIRRLSEYLPSSLVDRLRFQPCPTTVLSQMEKVMPSATRSSDRRIVSVNIAFDRPHLRFSGSPTPFLVRIGEFCRRASHAGWDVKIANHYQRDAAVVPWVRTRCPDAEVVDLFSMSSDDVVRFYASVDFAVGMRGHAQMIPFGVGTPIASVVSHEKLWWFLDDIGRRDWGVEAEHDDLPDYLMSRLETVDSSRRDVAAACEELWKVSRCNLEVMQREMRA